MSHPSQLSHPSHPPVRSVVFDFGGVLVPLDTARLAARFRELGMREPERWLDPCCQRGIFEELEGGLLSADEFIRKVSEACGREVSFADCRHAWLGIIAAPCPRKKLDLILRIRASGMRTAVLSNTNPFVADWMLSGEFDGLGHGIDTYFDAWYFSYLLRVMKPKPEIFRAILEGEKINAAATLFIDDGAANVATAASLGFQTLHVSNGEDWTGRLSAYLGLSEPSVD